MSKVSLKVVVAGRTYPLTVQEAEVARVQAAADDINKAIKQLQESFAVKDMQDLLAMTALQLATKSGKSTASNTSGSTDYSEVKDSLQNLLNQIEELN
jgi:cell division protein ZapA